MNIPTFKDQPEFVESALAADKTEKIDTGEPNKLAVGTDASLASIVQSFIATQSQTTHQLIDYIGKAVANASDDVRIGDRTLNNENQRNFLSEIVTNSSREATTPTLLKVEGIGNPEELRERFEVSKPPVEQPQRAGILGLMKDLNITRK